ncbi:MAG: polyribonucleotide nucleotidyltransferase [Candidatus Gracilibacteria bacterium]|nr:polyribonucleotide nucleotidyltransferase [Candidatus Gracilibacteria bacterium]
MHGISDKTAPNLEVLKKTYNIAGKDITFEAGRIGLLASGAVTISDEYGNVLFVTTGIEENNVDENAPFFPLMVDYQEKFYAIGKIGGNRFQRREGRPSDTAVLLSRLIDRPIRPMFADGFVNPTQIIATPLSSNGEGDLGFFGITGASLGLLMAGAPFEGPVSGVKITLTSEGKYIFDPSNEEQEAGLLTVVVAGTKDAITMVEASANEVSNDQMVSMLEYAHGVIIKVCEAQEDYLDAYSKLYGIKEIKAVYKKYDDFMLSKISDFLTKERLECLYNKGKKEFSHEVKLLEEAVIENFDLKEENPEGQRIKYSEVGKYVGKRIKQVMRENILERELRLDGRKVDEVRQIKTDVGLLPRVHGSGLFQRGMTQSLSITTLGGPADVQVVDDMFEEDEKRFIHHYNFPPYSVGDVRFLRGAGRREIGHGKLAEKALMPVLPKEEDFPYMMRVVSEITTCNGSSSMASVCGTTLSLMHAGVPIKAPVAGVAMGMIFDDKTKDYKILTDIQAQEDFLGDMDFKVARTPNGITAMQLDMKVKGLSMQVFREAFAQGGEATSHILKEMMKTINTPNKELSPYAPCITTCQITEKQISPVIGKGGENVQRMEKDYGASIHIADDGLVTITAENADKGQAVIDDIMKLIWEPSVGEKHEGKVIKIIDGVGAIVEFKGKSGMVHISKLEKGKTLKVEDVVKTGDNITVGILNVDKAQGRIALARIGEDVSPHNLKKSGENKDAKKLEIKPNNGDKKSEDKKGEK